MKNASDIAFDFNSIFWTGPWWLVLTVLAFLFGFCILAWGITLLIDDEAVPGLLLIVVGVALSAGGIVHMQMAYNDSRADVTQAFSEQGLIVNPDRLSPGTSFLAKDKSNNFIECTIIDDGFDNHYSVVCFK